MNRRLFLMAVAGAAGCSRPRRPRLNVFNWSSYIAPETIPAFETEFGVRVRYGVYESNEEMLARVMGGNSGWDVVFPSNFFIGPMQSYGLLAPIDKALLSNLDHLETRFRRPAWDPGLAWSVPYMWGSTGIVRSRAQAGGVSAWSDLWDGRLRGRITMLDAADEVLGACLKRLGFSWNSTSPDELRRAQRLALDQKPLLRAYLNAEVRDQVVSGDVLAAQMWATTAAQAAEGSPDVEYVFPEEGFSLYCDSAVILRESRRLELAHLFIDYLLRPPVAAAIVQAVKTATANATARVLLPDAVRSNATLYPPPGILRRGEWLVPMPPAAQRLRDRLWTEVKSA